MLWFCIGKKMQVIFKQELLIFIFFNMLLRNRHQNLKLFSFLFTELHKKWTCEAVTIIETPPMVAVGVVAYVKAPRGLLSLNTLWAQHLSEDIKRKFYKIWCISKKKAFTKYSNKFESDEGKKDIRFQLEKMKNYKTVIRVLPHTQAESFYFNALPFAKDVSEFQFQPFSNLPKSLQPNEEQQEAANEEQQEAADKLVMMMDMAPAGREEAVWPDFTPNPVLEV